MNSEIDITTVLISSNRQRREFNLAALNELAESIQARGLFHAIVLRQTPEGWLLVSGERRLRAMQDIIELGGQFLYNGAVYPKDGFVPFVSLGDLDPLAAEEAELDENIKRKDLTWQEHAAATSRLAGLRTRQATLTGSPAPTTADLVVEIHGEANKNLREPIRRELIVAKHLNNPEVAGAKTLEEGYKILKRQEETKRNQALAETVGASLTSKSHTALNCNALEWLASAPAEAFDVILTDPPYGVDADQYGDSNGAGGAVGQHQYEDSAENFVNIVEACQAHLFRIAKPQAHLYWFCDIQWFDYLKTMFAAAGWTVFRTPLIYHKPNAARAPWPHSGPQRQYDLILYAKKGDKPVTRLRSDVLIYPPDPQLGHQAQKPVAAYMDLLSRSVRPGDSVLDPFAGSGTIFPAAHELKCLATGIEQSSGSYGIMIRRLQTLDAKQELLNG